MAKPNQRTTAAACPCGSGEPYSRCCRPFHLRLAEPPTAEQLMRSRYSAYAKGLDAYLLHSWDPAHRPATIELDPRHRWTGLTIIATSGGAPDDTAGTVEFVAAFEIEDEWYYSMRWVADTSALVESALRDGRRVLLLPGAENDIMPIALRRHPDLLNGSLEDAYNANEDRKSVV